MCPLHQLPDGDQGFRSDPARPLGATPPETDPCGERFLDALIDNAPGDPATPAVIVEDRAFG